MFPKERPLGRKTNHQGSSEIDRDSRNRIDRHYKAIQEDLERESSIPDIEKLSKDIGTEEIGLKTLEFLLGSNRELLSDQELVYQNQYQ